MKSYFLVLSGVVGVALFAPVVAMAVAPQLPHLFYGSVLINGVNAPAGTVIVAQVGGVEKGRITTTEVGKYGGTGALEQKLLVQGEIANGATITFSFDGHAAAQTAIFESEKIEELNLSFSFTITQPPSGGGSSNTGGGGGGGGGGGVNNPPVTGIVGDTNNDNKVDILDFNALMVNWGVVTAGNVADLDKNGRVDIFDFNLLMVNWT